MEGYKAKFRVATLVVISIWVGLAALYDLVKPISNGCIMTYMYPQYIPVSSPGNVSASKYGLYLYHEGWKPIDYSDHLKKLSGVPVLFIPGNGGSYKQASFYFFLAISVEQSWTTFIFPIKLYTFYLFSLIEFWGALHGKESYRKSICIFWVVFPCLAFYLILYKKFWKNMICLNP